MKKLTLAAFAALAAVGSASAGETVMQSAKTYQPPVPELCFAERELQIDVFGAYAFTQSDQDAILGDHGWGGGIGVNYFFTRNLGVGVEGTLLDPSHRGDVIGQAALNIFYRFPIDGSCFAPYVYLGGGGVFNAEQVDRTDFDFDDDDDDSDADAFWAAHAGVGVEYRFKPNVGVFVDGRFTVVDQTSNNFATIRAGVRFAF